MPDQSPSEKDMRLDAIVDYDMTELESRAYKLTLLWLDLSRKAFPEYKHAKMAAKGDPRKSLIFKQCYKLVRETQGILEERDYPLYVRAQLEILKYISTHRPSNHCLIGPNCLCGDKAWIRWKMWKRKYDSVSKVNETSSVVPANLMKVASALTTTKEFLVKTFTEAKFEDLQLAVANKNFYRWINMGKISPYYLVLSPFVKKLFPEGITGLAMDLDVFRGMISPEIETLFKKMFPNEATS